MEKILFAIDATNISIPALDFACYIGRLTRSTVTGVFLENLVIEKTPALKNIGGTSYLEWGIDPAANEYKEKQMMIEKNIAFFKEACEKRSVRCSVHRDRGIPADEIIAESRFADLIITDASISFNRRYEGMPTEFIKNILANAECPVIVAPESFDGIDELIFTYNGSKSSAFAIRQFTYLFPELGDKKTTILQVNEKGEWQGIEKHNLKEWLAGHYSAIGFDVVKGDIDYKLFDYLLKKKNVFIVMGAYGRGSLSRFFKQSQADRVIKTVTQPIFISHY
jgi:nucleotide-binding universal stress UspA family protein